MPSDVWTEHLASWMTPEGLALVPAEMFTHTIHPMASE